MIYVLAVFIGVVAGLRAVLALAAVSWATAIGAIDLGTTWLAFIGFKWAPLIISVAAVAELVNDKLPATPSRTIAPQFAVRLVAGGLSGAAIALPTGSWVAGAVAGLLGAIIGTLGGSRLRAVLSKALRKDLPAAILEDGVAILLSVIVLSLL